MEVVHGAGFFKGIFQHVDTAEKLPGKRRIYFHTAHMITVDRGKVSNSIAPCSTPVHLVSRETPMDKMHIGPLIDVNFPCYII
jgi:hypothetical protein